MFKLNVMHLEYFFSGCVYYRFHFLFPKQFCAFFSYSKTLLSKTSFTITKHLFLFFAPNIRLLFKWKIKMNHIAIWIAQNCLYTSTSRSGIANELCRCFCSWDDRILIKIAYYVINWIGNIAEIDFYIWQISFEW